MTTTDHANTTSWAAVAAPVDQPVRPRAWALPIPAMAGGGDLLRAKPTTDRPEAWEPLYDQAALDAAVAAERERYAKLQQVWEDTRTQRDELLAHLTRKEPLPAWAAEWIRVYGA